MNTDDSLRNLFEQINREERGTSIIDPARMKEFSEALEIANKLFQDDKQTKVTYKLHEPYASMGSIQIAGPDLLLTDPQEFHHAVSLASNLSVTPMTDGTIKANLTFHGLTVHVQEDSEQ